MTRAPLLLGLAFLCASGCEARANELRTVTSAMLPCQRTTEGGGWETAPLPPSRQACVDEQDAECPWLAYDGRDTLHIEHTLGRVPSDVLVYLSFDRNGCGAALTAGDTARIQEVRDDRISIHNATEGDYFVRVTLR